MFLIDPQTAFENAIKGGVLSEDKNANNFAGKYMYMGEMDNNGNKFGSGFKNIITREYLWNNVKEVA